MSLTYIRSVVIVLCLIAAVVCLSIASVSYFRSRAFARAASRAQGTVIRVEEKRGHEGLVTFVSIFQFRDTSGTLHTVRDSISASPALHAVGDSVSVLYHRTSPDAARIDSFMSLWGLSMVMAILGAAALLISLVVYVAAEVYLRTRNRRVSNVTLASSVANPAPDHQ
jgi:hypothetical protein